MKINLETQLENHTLRLHQSKSDGLQDPETKHLMAHEAEQNNKGNPREIHGEILEKSWRNPGEIH